MTDETTKDPRARLARHWVKDFQTTICLKALGNSDEEQLTCYRRTIAAIAGALATLDHRVQVEWTLMPRTCSVLVQATASYQDLAETVEAVIEDAILDEFSVDDGEGYGELTMKPERIQLSGETENEATVAEAA